MPQDTIFSQKRRYEVVEERYGNLKIFWYVEELVLLDLVWVSMVIVTKCGGKS
jgi:hypothetical protein